MNIKKELYNQCISFVNKRLQTIEDTISSNQNALQSEIKSSAGDKHETGRAMLQLEMEKAGQQLSGVSQMKHVLAKIDVSKSSKTAHLGSLIFTNKVNYFLSISAGKLTVLGLDYGSGLIFGTGISGIEKLREAIYKIDDQKVRRLGSTTVLQTMASGISAYLAGILGLGNQVTTNSSACTTGTEALLIGFERIKNGKAKRMLVGSSSDSSLYTWGGFDAMKVMSYKHNESPQKGSRPMSETASGFVPGSGSGALVLESLESALERKAKIYAEVLGGNINSGGQRNGGTLTAPNSQAVQKCIKNAIIDAGVSSNEIDLINGHLTATSKDALEIENWTKALQRKGDDFPHINSLKSMIGHCLSAAGAIESVASVIQLKEQFIFPNINCEDIHPEISKMIAKDKIPQNLVKKEINIIAKASFGFGDVNACVILKKYSK